jgi:ferredoxin
MGLAPEVFRVEDDETVVVLVDQPDDALRPRVDEAVAACPRQAISVEEL